MRYGSYWLNDCAFWLNILSGIAFGFTALIFIVTRVSKDLRGKCIVHYAINFSLAHLLVVTVMVGTGDYLPDHFCLIHYLVVVYFILAAFMWMQILSFSTWKMARNQTPTDPNMIRYYSTGYGIPLVIMILAVFEMLYLRYMHSISKCHAMSRSSVFQLAAFPAVIMLCISFFYFIDSQCRLWKIHNNHSQSTGFKKVLYRSMLYFKLSAIMGFPWMLLLISILIHPFLFYYNRFLNIVSVIVLSSEGITFFIFTVLCQKRILRQFLKNSSFGTKLFSIICRNSNDNDSESESIDGISNEGNNDAETV